MVYNREEAAQRAEASQTNVEGTCQLWTRTMLGAGSAGDQDGDGDADAVDGWNSEPVEKRHTDRNPPRGTPVAWSGGSHGFGHRAMSLGNGKIRSTDAGGSGHVATVDLGWVESTWGMHYLGWSETITGIEIPLPPQDNPTGEDDMKPEDFDAIRKIVREEVAAADLGTERIANPGDEGPNSRSLSVVLWTLLKLQRKIAKKVGAE